MHVKAIGDRVLVELLEKEQTKGFQFDTSEEGYPARGKVITIGADVKEVAIGDVVLFSRNASAVKLPDGTIILTEKSIYAIE